MPSYLLPVAFGVLAIGYAIWGRRRVATALAENSDKTFAAVAARLGLSVSEGDGSVNLLYFQQPKQDFERTLRAVGQPYAHPAALTLLDGKSTSEYLVMREVKTSFGCFLEISSSATLPVFEVVLRNPNQYLVPNQQFAEHTELVPAATGNAAIDAQFSIRASDPRVAPALVPTLELMSSMLYVHLACAGTRLYVSFTRFGLAYFSSAAEEYLLALETAACALEGRPLPARPGAQVFSAPAM
jgi:hypothetical protein